MNRFILPVLFILVASSCQNNESESSTDQPDTSEVAKKLNDSLTSTPSAQFAEGMEVYTNMEWVPYCIPLPLATYPEVFEKEPVKAQHTFVNAKNKEYYITVKGMERSDTTVSIEKYFTNTYTAEDEEQGKIITSKNISKNVHCFYALGYWNNSIHTSRFLEITWLRDTEVVTMEAVYPIEDTSVWTGYLTSFITVDSNCE